MYGYCVDRFGHIQCYSDCWRMGSHLVEPVCYGVVSVCSSVTLYVRKINERMDMDMFEVPLSMYLFYFGMGKMLANFQMYGIMLLLRAVLNMLVRKESPTEHIWFRCLMFIIPGPCELLFLLCFIAYWTRVVVSVMFYPCILCMPMDISVLCAA